MIRPILEIASEINFADYIHVDPSGENTYAFITLGRTDNQNIGFAGDKICDLICDIDIAGINGNNGLLNKNGSNNGVNISIVEAGALDSAGNFIPLAIDSINAIITGLAKPTLIASAMTSHQNTITWTTDTTKATHYVLERSIHDNLSFTVLDTLPVTDTVYTYQDMGLLAATTYYYRVKNINLQDSLVSNCSEIDSATTLAIGLPNGYPYSTTLLEYDFLKCCTC